MAKMCPQNPWAESHPFATISTVQCVRHDVINTVESFPSYTYCEFIFVRHILSASHIIRVIYFINLCNAYESGVCTYQYSKVYGSNFLKRPNLGVTYTYFVMIMTRFVWLATEEFWIFRSRLFNTILYKF